MPTPLSYGSTSRSRQQNVETLRSIKNDPDLPGFMRHSSSSSSLRDIRKSNSFSQVAAASDLRRHNSTTRTSALRRNISMGGMDLKDTRKTSLSKHLSEQSLENSLHERRIALWRSRKAPSPTWTTTSGSSIDKIPEDDEDNNNNNNNNNNNDNDNNNDDTNTADRIYVDEEINVEDSQYAGRIREAVNQMPFFIPGINGPARCLEVDQANQTSRKLSVKALRSSNSSRRHGRTSKLSTTSSSSSRTAKSLDKMAHQKLNNSVHTIQQMLDEITNNNNNNNNDSATPATTQRPPTQQRLFASRSA